MQRNRKFRADEISEIIATFKRMTSVENRGIMEATRLIAAEWGRTPEVMYSLIRRFQPSTDAAKMFVEANALRLAMRVVRKANVEQSIDILSRTNVGVLAPNKAQENGGGGFFLSVQTDGLGAVRVGLAQGQGGSGSLPSATSPVASGHEEGQQVIDVTPPALPPSVMITPGTVDFGSPEPEKPPSVTDRGVPHPTQGTFKGKTLSARALRDMESARKKLTAARRDAQLKKNREIKVK